MKNQAMEVVKMLGKGTAKKAVNSASWPFFFQKKEPDTVREKLMDCRMR